MNIKIYITIIGVFLFSLFITGCKQSINESSSTKKNNDYKVVHQVKEKKTSSEATSSKITSNVPTSTPKNQFFQLYMANNTTGWALTGQKIFAKNQDKWVEVPPHKDLKNQNEFITLYAVNEKIVWTANRENLFNSTDGGKTWSSMPIPKFNKDLNTDGVQFSFINPSKGWMLVHHGFAAGQSPIDIYQTTNHGVTWELVDHNANDTNNPHNIPTNKDPKSITFIDEKHGFLTGDGNDPHEVIFYNTNDGGKTWDQLNIPLPRLEDDDFLSYSAPQFFDQFNAILSVTIRGLKKNTTLLYSSSDKGDHWKQISKLEGMGEVTFLNNKIGWADIKGSINDNTSILYQTKNGGKTWNNITPLTFSLNNLEFTSAQIGWGISDKNGKIMQSNDGGRTWNVFSEISNTRKEESKLLQLADAKGGKFTAPISSVPIYEKYLNDQSDKKPEINRSSTNYLNLKNSDGSSYNILKYNCGNKLCSTLLIKISKDKKIMSSIELGYGTLIDMKQSPNLENVVFRYGVNEGNIVMRNNIIPINVKDMKLLQPKSKVLSGEFIEKATWPITDYNWVNNNTISMQTADIKKADYDSLLSWYKSTKSTKNVTTIFKEY